MLALWLICAGLAIAWTGLTTIRSDAWRQPTLDQFRVYRVLFSQPFPWNLLEAENQHRPVFPGLLRVAEIHLTSADQSLQIGVGALLAFLTAALVAAAAWRAPGAGAPARSAGVAAAFIGVFWLGNARMLLHGNELVHVYLVTLCVCLAGVTGTRSAAVLPARRVVLGSLAAVVATFSFGPGIALFPVVVVLAWLQRAPARLLAVPVLTCLLCLWIYTQVLPGDDSVRASMDLRPLESLQVAARWLASPWVNAWLGFADPPLRAHDAGFIASGMGRFLAPTANAVSALTGLSWEFGLSTLIGALGAGALAVVLVSLARRREALAPIQSVALALALFGAGSALIIGIGRIEYFEQHPRQIFADRYLVWPCLFWLGLTLLALFGTRPRLRGMALGVVAILPLVLWPTHQLGSAWGASVLRGNLASAAAVRADVLDRDILWPEDPSVAFEDKLYSLAQFRLRGLAMFAPAGSLMLGQRLPEHRDPGGELLVHFDVPRPSQDVRDDRPAARFSGAVKRGRDQLPTDPVMVVVGPDDVIVGFAVFTHSLGGATWPRWWAATRDGLDGFIRNFDAGATYRVFALDARAERARWLGSLPPASATWPK